MNVYGSADKLLGKESRETGRHKEAVSVGERTGYPIRSPVSTDVTLSQKSSYTSSIVMPLKGIRATRRIAPTLPAARSACPPISLHQAGNPNYIASHHLVLLRGYAALLEAHSTRLRTSSGISSFPPTIGRASPRLNINQQAQPSNHAYPPKRESCGCAGVSANEIVRMRANRVALISPIAKREPLGVSASTRTATHMQFRAPPPKVMVFAELPVLSRKRSGLKTPASAPKVSVERFI